MKKTQRKTLFLLLVLALLAFPTAVALAKEFQSLAISGPGIDGEVTIDDPEGIMDLERSDFFFRPQNVKAPENLGEGYSITAFMNLDGPIVPFVQMVYYPADAGEPGYVHYTGRMGNTAGELEAVDDWSLLTAEADTAFRDLMAEHGIALQPAVLAASAAAASAAGSSSQTESQTVSEPVNVPAPLESKPQAVSEPAAVPPASTGATSRLPYPALALVGAILALLAGALVLRRRALAQNSA